jgi:hypothetical protein
MGTLCSHKPKHIKATDFLINNHLNWSSHDAETGEKHTVLATALVGMREFYAAVEHVKPDGSREVWAAVLKVSWFPKDYYGFCVKSMSEHDGPYYHNCPEKILKLLTPIDSENAQAWRAKCWERLGARKIVKKVGDKVELWGRTYHLDENLGRRGYRVHDVETGKIYRMNVNHIKQSTLVEAP